MVVISFIDLGSFQPVTPGPVVTSRGLGHVYGLPINIETRLTQVKGLIQVKNLTSEAIQVKNLTSEAIGRVMNLTYESLGCRPEFMTRAVTCQNQFLADWPGNCMYG